MKTITRDNFAANAAGWTKEYHAKYYSMYSSVFDGITTDPALMLVPVDDHLVHRGDGVFETLKCVDGALYNLEDHLLRLRNSAASLNLDGQYSDTQITELTIATVRAGGHENCSVRIIISRGPGSFAVNPYDCPVPQLYIIVTYLPPPFMQLHPAGARVRRSSIRAKPAFMAGIKNCNYLPNVLMKKEAVDLGVDLTVAYDDRDCMGEGPTENLGIVTRDGRLLFPPLDNILRGTTMTRVMTLAHELVPKQLASVDSAAIREDDIANAAEMLIVGTTWNVAAVREYNGQAIGNGNPGPVFSALYKLLDNDIHNNNTLRTPV